MKIRFLIGFGISFLALFLVMASVQAAVGVPKILSYQGRLLDSSGNLLGGAGTQYCFRFSIYDAITAGTKLWPAATSSAMTATVTNGVFDIGVGDTGAGGDVLTYNFNDNDTVFLDVAVATKVDPVCTGASEVFETLTPRQRIVASGFAINSLTLNGFSAAQNASSSEIPVLSSGNLTLGGVNPQINATGTNTLTLQGGSGTGAIQFFSASNFINASGSLTIASRMTATQLQATATSSQFVFQGTAATGSLTWDPTSAAGLNIPTFSTATDTIALTNFAQTLFNKTLSSTTLIAGVSIIQNAAATGLAISQNAVGMALGITNAPTSTQATSTVAITAGANVSGGALMITNFGSGNAIQVNDSSTAVFSIASSGNALFNPSTDNALALTVRNASGTSILFGINTASNTVKIGDNSGAGTVPTLLGLDIKADAGDPTGVDGEMYYSSSTDRFRCFQGGAWANCVPGPLDYQPLFATTRWGFWAPVGITATAFTAVNAVAPTVNGTAAASAQAEDFYVQWTTPATNGTIAGATSTFTQTEARYTPRIATRIRTDTTITSRRIWFALNSATITGTDLAAGAQATTFMGLRYSTGAADTTWECGSGDGTTASYTNTGVTVSVSSYYDLILDASVAGQLTCEVAKNGGAFVSVTKSTNVPTSSVALGITDAATTLAATAIVHRSAYVYIGGRGN